MFGSIRKKTKTYFQVTIWYAENISLFSNRKHFKIIQERNDIFKMSMKNPVHKLPKAPQLHFLHFLLAI